MGRPDAGAGNLQILLFHKGGIGDIVFVVPLIRDLRRAYPRSQITLLTHAKGREVLGFCPDIDEIFVPGGSQSGWSLHTAAKLLAYRRFDVAITSARSFRAAYLLWQSRAQIRVGFAGGPEQADQRLLNDPIRCFNPSMIFVCTHFMRADLIENPAVAQDRRRIDIADLKRDAETRTRGSRRQ